MNKHQYSEKSSFCNLIYMSSILFHLIFLKFLKRVDMRIFIKLVISLDFKEVFEL